MEKKKRMKNHGDSVCYIMVLSCPLVAYPFREATIQVFIGKSFFHITSRRIIDLRIIMHRWEIGKCKNKCNSLIFTALVILSGSMIVWE